MGKIEKISLKDCVFKYSNNFDLGSFVRHNIKIIKTDLINLEKLCFNYSNDFDLGKFCRIAINEVSKK